MRCSYCGSNITPYPGDGICPNCGGQLPPLPKQQPVPRQPQVVYHVPLRPGINCCGRCMSTDISTKNRGFSWGWGLLGLFLLPPFGILFGFCGSKKLVSTCRGCGHKWKR